MAIKTNDGPGVDLRIRRSRQSLRDGFCEAAAAKTKGKLSVEEIAKAAFVNRKTFYMHYEKISDVMDDVEQHLMEELGQRLDTDDLTRALTELYSFFEEKNYLKVLLFDPRYEYFAKKFMDDVLSRECFRPLYEDMRYPAIAKDFLKSVFFIYRDWDKDGRDEVSVDELASEAAKLVAHGR